MSRRLRLEPPERILFRTELAVRITDINYGNHVGNDSFIGLIHEARMRWLHDHGWSELDIEGYALILVDLAIQFKQQARYADRLAVELGVLEWTVPGFVIGYRIAQAASDRTVSLCSTSMVFFDYQAGRIQARPDWFQGRVLHPPS